MPPSKAGRPSLNVVIFPLFFPGRAKDLSTPRYIYIGTRISVNYKITLKICEILQKHVAMVATSKKEEEAYT
jgi:hypothetical protein